MRPGQIWKHINFRCVAIRILKSYYVKERKRYNVKVEWWRNSKCNGLYSMGFTQRINIYLKDIHDGKWELLDD